MNLDAQALATLARLAAESDIRRLIARYMRLCDVPLPDADLSEAERVVQIAALFAAEGIWEGVGERYTDQFGRLVGRQQIADHFTRFFSQADPALVFNTHYLTTEHLEVDDAGAEGLWVQFQPWIFEDGRSVLRSSRLRCRFVQEGGAWKIAHYRTENVFVAPLPEGWATHFPQQYALLAQPMA